MQNLTINIPHQLSREEARRRIQGQIDQLRQQHGGMLSRLEDRWTGDRLDFTAAAMGVTVSGWAVVEDNVVRLEVVLPWLLAALAGPVKQRIEQQGRNLLGHR
jgi:putative polyhydroxyalkanoate system protein